MRVNYLIEIMELCQNYLQLYRISIFFGLFAYNLKKKQKQTNKQTETIECVSTFYVYNNLVYYIGNTKY